MFLRSLNGSALHTRRFRQTGHRLDGYGLASLALGLFVLAFSSVSSLFRLFRLFARAEERARTNFLRAKKPR